MSQQFDELRKTEFSRLDAGGHVYLDYTGSGLYGESQIRAHTDMLQHEVLGNPHSENPTSLAATEHVEAARQRIREFFRADRSEYEVIFTSNASGALKLVGESYPFAAGSRYVLVADNHNSVNGIREFARTKGADIRYVPLNHELRVDAAVLAQNLSGADKSHANLFAFPAQSNFSGVKHPLEWIEQARGMGYDVLLDAAAFAPTSRLDLSAIKPDFVSLSFYKMFGFPTGVGALIARRDALMKLQRPWFAGGTVRFVSAQNNVHYLQVSGEAFEDGTLNFISIAGVVTGLGFLDSIGIDNINAHVSGLTARLLNELLTLKHSNGEPLVEIYGPQTLEQHGGTVAFNVIDPDGGEVDFKVVERRANEHKISLRTGCFCNPGASETAFDYSKIEAYRCFNLIEPADFTMQQFSTCLSDAPIGAVRVSVGLPTVDADVDALLALLRTFIDCEPMPIHDRNVPEIVGG